MVRFKKTSTIKIGELIPKLGEGFSFSDFFVLNNGNILMVFEKKISENETRYIIKVHTRVGLQRQCSFTAVDSFLVNAYLSRGELYAYLWDGEGMSVARLEPDTKEDLVPLEKGMVKSFCSKELDRFILGYEDGRVIRYEKGKPEVLAEAGSGYVSFDCNERLIWSDGDKIKRQMVSKAEEYGLDMNDVDCFCISRDDRSALAFKEGKLYVLQRSAEGGFNNPLEFDGPAGDKCRMNKSTVAVLDGLVLTVGTI